MSDVLQIFCIDAQRLEALRRKMSDSRKTRLLIEREVAELLRCSVSKVKRLRLSRQLGYLQGRPVLVPEEDAEEYVLRIRIEAAMKEAAKDHKAWEKQERKRRQVEPIDATIRARRKHFVRKLRMQSK